MNRPLEKNVSRETTDISRLTSLFVKDADFNQSFDLLSHREHLIFNTNNPGFALIWLKLLRERGYFPLVIFRSEHAAESFYADSLGFFEPSSVVWIPLFSSSSSIKQEDAALENHLSGFLDDYYRQSVNILISAGRVFDTRVPDKQGLRKHMLHFKAGDDISYSTLSEKLTEMGYQRSNMAEYCGEFAFRGGIVDIYPYGETYPFRMELWGDKIESIRRFNPNDQNTFEPLEEARVRPASFSRFSRTTIKDILSDNTVVIYLENPEDSDSGSIYQKDIPFKQVFFHPAHPNADVRFSVDDADLPKGLQGVQFSENILKGFGRIFVASDQEIIRRSFEERFGDGARYLSLNISSGFRYKNLDLILLSGREVYRKEHYVNPSARFIPDTSRRIEDLDSLEYGEAVVHIDYGIGIYRGIELLEFKGVKQESMVVEYRNKDRVFVPIRHMNKIFKYSGQKPSATHLDQIGSARWEQAKTATRNYLKKAAFDLFSLYRDRKSLPGFAFFPDTPDALRLAATFPFDETPDQSRAIDDIRLDMEKDRIMDRLVCGDVGFGKTEVAIRAAFKAVYSGKQVAVLVPTTMLCFQHYETFLERLEPFGINVDYVNRFVPAARLKRNFLKIKNGQTDIVVGTHKILSNILLFNDLGLLIVDEEHRFGVNHKEKIQNMKRHIDVLTLTATPIPRTLQLSLAGLKDITKIDTPPKERLPISTKLMFWNEADIQFAIRRELERNGQVFILHNVIEEQPALQRRIEAMFPGIGVRTAHGKLSGNELENTMLDFYHHRFDVLISTTIIESGIDVPNANTLIVMNAHKFGLSQLYQIRGRVGRSFRKAFAYLVLPRGKHINPTAMKRLQTLEYYTDLGSGYQISMRDLEIRGAGSLFGVEQSGHINRLGYAYFNRLFAEEVERVKTEAAGEKLTVQNVPDLHLEQAAYFPENYIDNKDIRISFYRNISEIVSSGKNTAAAERELKHVAWSCADRFGPLPSEAENLFKEARLSVWLKTFHVSSLVKKDEGLLAVFSKDVPVGDLQSAAGKLLRILNENHISVEFISKQQLSARIAKSFITSFFNGTFQY